MGNKFVEIEFQNRTTLVKLSEIRMLELAEEGDLYTLTIFISSEDTVTVEAEAGNEKMVQDLYNELRAKLEAL
ncbi:MAG TPA: hypothetical protein VNX47_02390 [Nevskia sp.]|jgi:hypothetical protein|nr:hypothetical protein [Nevskia sp.]